MSSSSPRQRKHQSLASRGAKKSFKGAHGEHRTGYAKGMKFQVPRPRVEMPKVSRRWGMGQGIPLPSQLGDLWEHRIRSLSGIPGRAPAKTILLLSKRVRMPLVATFVEN